MGTTAHLGVPACCLCAGAGTGLSAGLLCRQSFLRHTAPVRRPPSCPHGGADLRQPENRSEAGWVR